MAPISLPYEETFQNTMDQLKNKNLGVLATAEGENVTAREMVFVCNGTTISFVTTIYTRKYKQIMANNNVAVSIDNIQIEGFATIRGRPSDEENAWFIEALPELAKKNWLDLFMDPERPERIIEIHPKRIALYYGPPNGHFDVLNIGEQKALRYDSLETLVSYE